MNYLEKNKEKFINDLKGLIKIESYLRDSKVYPIPEIISAVNYMVELGDKEGFKTYVHPEGYYGYMEIGTGDEMIGILGHLDVVPPGEDIEKWDNNPFDLKIEDGKLFGRGTQDDKGPVMLGFYLLKSIVESGIELNKRIRLIFPTDEETFWRGVEKYKEDNQDIPTFGFTPDATFPLVYSERELWEFKITSHGSEQFKFNAGSALNVVPDKAIFIKDGIETIVEGKAAHAMEPWKGENAITKLLENINVEHPMINFLKKEIDKETNGEKLFGKLFSDKDAELSVNFAKLNIDSEKGEMYFDLRIPNTTNKEELKEILINKLSNEYPELYFEEYDWLKGVYLNPESTILKTYMETYREVTGDNETMPIATGGATYARGMDNIVAFGPFQINSPVTEHQYNEFALWDDFVIAFEIYSKVFKKLL